FSATGMILAKANLERRYMAPDAITVSRVLENKIGPVLIEHDIPITAKVVVLGDPSPDGALLFMNRKGWAYGPKELVPPLDSLIDLGADHLLVLGATTAKWSQYELLDQQGTWRLFS